MATNHLTAEMVQELTKKLANEGKLVAAGFAGMRSALIPEGASQQQIDDMEMAYFGGAQHIWTSLMAIMDAGTEPTAADLRRMDLIQREMVEIEKRLRARVHGRPQ